MSEKELKQIADDAAMIVKGYAFSYKDNFISVLNLNNPSRAMLISKDGEIVDAAVNLGIIEKAGAWFSYINQESGRSERWQGKEKVKDALSNDETLKNEIEERVKIALYPQAVTDGE